MDIVVLDGNTLNPGDNPWDQVGNLGDLSVYDRTDERMVLERAWTAEVLVINKVHLTDTHFQKLTALKLVTVTATGYDCVDIQAAHRHGVVVCNVPVYGTASVAQHVMALLLHMIHRIDLHDRAIRQGEWQACGDFSFWKSALTELAGKRMGVIGFGRIGRKVGQLAHAFDMEVLACTRTAREASADDSIRFVSQPVLLQESDVISLNCPLTDDTRGMVNRPFLESMKRSAILINAARGPLVVEADLADALNAGRIRAAGLDVACQEPIAQDSPLLHARNCYLTPHLAWATLEARKRLMQVTVENIQRFLAGTPQNVVNAR